MPHDHDHWHDHPHAPLHAQSSGHSHAHSHNHPHHHPSDGRAEIGHNGAPPDHLHSHMPHGHDHHGDAARQVVEDLCAAFIDGFREAPDKVSFLRLAGVPFEIPGDDGPMMQLVDVAVRTDYQVGTASPGFASEELVYMPFVGAMVRERINLDFTYVSLKERRDVPLAEFLQDRL